MYCHAWTDSDRSGAWGVDGLRGNRSAGGYSGNPNSVECGPCQYVYDICYFSDSSWEKSDSCKFRDGGLRFFWGGTMIWILNRLRTVLKGNVSLILTLIMEYLSYLIVLGAIGVIRRKKENSLKTVMICVPESAKEITVRAFLDTGNHLTDPMSGKPVCVVSKQLAEKISDCFKPEKYHAVPFRSIGRECGILDAYELQEMVIEDEERQIRKERVIVAICNTGIPEESIYQMILHPRLLED